MTSDISVTNSTSIPMDALNFSHVYDLIDYLNMVITPLAFVTGILGNLTTIIVMNTHQFINFGSRHLLIALAIADLSVIVTQPLKNLFLIDLLGCDIRSLTIFGCKLYFGVHKTGKMASSWIVVSLAIERLAAVRYPFQVKQWFSDRNIFIGMCMMFFVLAGFNVGYAYYTEIDSNGICNPDIYNKSNSAAVSTYHHVFNAGVTLYFIGPLVILFTVIPMILISLIKIGRQRAQISSSCKNITLRPTIMLLTVMFGYIVFVTPIGIVRIVVNYSGDNLYDVDMTWFSTFRNIAFVLEIINYAINFFLYVCSSEEFRQGVKDLLRRSCNTFFR